MLRAPANCFSFSWLSFSSYYASLTPQTATCSRPKYWSELMPLKPLKRSAAEPTGFSSFLRLTRRTGGYSLLVSLKAGVSVFYTSLTHHRPHLLQHQRVAVLARLRVTSPARAHRLHRLLRRHRLDRRRAQRLAAQALARDALLRVTSGFCCHLLLRRERVGEGLRLHRHRLRRQVHHQRALRLHGFCGLLRRRCSRCDGHGRCSKHSRLLATLGRLLATLGRGLALHGRRRFQIKLLLHLLRQVLLIASASHKGEESTAEQPLKCTSLAANGQVSRFLPPSHSAAWTTHAP